MDTSGQPPRPGSASGGPSGGAEPGRSLPLILVVLAASVVVAITTNGLRLVGPPVDPSPALLWAIRFAGAAAIGGGLAVLLGQRRRLQAEGGRSDPTVVAVRTAAAIMGVLTVVALMVHPVGSSRAGGGDASSSSLGRPAVGGNDIPGLPGLPSGSMSGNAVMGGGAGGRAGAAAGPLEPQAPGLDRSPLQRMARSLLPLLLLMIAAIAFRALTRGPRPGELELYLELPLDPAEAEASLAASLLEIESDSPDPRRRITAAYHRLLAALATAGAPRRPQEAPYEYLNRALGPLGVRPEPLHRLTELYVLAQFSERPITALHRAAAAEALDASLARLREVHGSPPAAEAATTGRGAGSS